MIRCRCMSDYAAATMHFSGIDALLSADQPAAAAGTRVSPQHPAIDDGTRLPEALMESDLFFTSAVELAQLIRAKQISAREVVEVVLRNIDAANQQTNAFTEITHELALRSAARCDAALSRGEVLGPLHGIPVGIKDLFDFRAGVRNTFGSLPLADFVPDFTAEYVRRLESAGALVVGKTNAPEFGHKGITDNFVSGATSTPFNLSRNSGGSSGGSAAAVADGLVPLAQGTDGGGSLRIPSSWCGTFGFKPSFGRVPDLARPDSAASTSPFISTGPVARSVADAALMMSVMAGPHPRDPYSLPADIQDWTIDEARASDGLAGKRIAFSADLDAFPVQSEVAALVTRAARVLQGCGAQVDELRIAWPADQFELSSLWLRITGSMYISALEFIRGLGIDLIRDHLDVLTPAFRDMVLNAQTFTTEGVLQDKMLRTMVQDAVQDVFDDYDFIASSTLALPAVPNGPKGETLGPREVNGVTVDPSIGWCLTYPFNYTGNPAASVPCGLTADGLPVGLQLVGRQHADLDVLAACANFEAAAPWLHTYPKNR